jgi:hypothetical protein
MESNKRNIFTSSGRCPDATQLWKYAHGKLTSHEQQNIELHALDCPFCEASVEGYKDVQKVPDLKGVRGKLFGRTSLFWPVISVGLGIVALLWVNYFFNISQQEPVKTLPVPEIIPEIGNHREVENERPVTFDSSSVLHSNTATPQQLKTERIRHWGDELFMIEKRGIVPLPSSDINARVKQRSRYKIIYMEGLKVIEYPDRVSGADPALEIDRGLHPRYANNTERGGEQIYSDTDTVLYIDLLRDALRAFNLGTCLQVVGQLKCIGEKYPDDQNVWFYSGMCEKNLGEYQTAVGHFSKMINDETSPFFEEALWHSALCYEEMNEKATAAVLFKKIKDMDGYYSRQAAGKL